MLSMSRVITSIKMDLGVYGLSLPFDNPDEALRNVIKIITYIQSILTSIYDIYY